MQHSESTFGSKFIKVYNSVVRFCVSDSLEVEAELSNDNVSLFYTKGSSSIAGNLYFGITFTCSLCFKYVFVIKVGVDLTNKCIIGSFLNSETFFLKEKEDKYHQIRNIYELDITEYIFDESILKLPIIEFDDADFNKFFNRVKTLAVFS